MKGRTLMSLGIACIIGVAAAFGPGLWLPAQGLVIFWIVGKIRKLGKIHMTLLCAVFLLGFWRGDSVSRAWEQARETAVSLEGQTLTIFGKVIETRQTARSFQCYLICEGQKILCRLEDIPGQPIYRDDRLSLQGTCRLFSPADNPGQYDEAAYNRSLGAAYKLDGCQILSHKRPVFSLLRELDKCRDCMAAFYSKAFSEDVSGIIKAMVLGDRSDFTAELKTYYKANGWLHLVTVSGLHMSFMGAGLYRTLRKRCRVREGWAEAAALLMTVLYSLLTGFGFSLQRAWIMFVFQTGGRFFGRTNDFATSTVVSAAVILFRRPMALTYSGLWFSYGAIAGMAVGGHMSAVFEKKEWIREHPAAQKLIRAVSIQAAIFLSTLPILLYFSYEIPVYGLLYSLWLIPVISRLIPLMTVLGAAGSIFSAQAPILAALLLACRPIQAFFLLLHRLPAKTWIAGFPSLFWSAVYILTGVAWLFYSVSGCQRRVWPHVVRTGFLVSLAVLVFSRRPSLFLTCLDVGQGDGLCLMTPEDRTVMIDGGSSSVSQVGIYRVQPFLKYYGRQKVDLWFLSHSDEDHISGCREILEEGQIKVDRLIVPDVKEDEAMAELTALARSRGTRVERIRAGEKIWDGTTSFYCLHPRSGADTEDANESSMVLLVTCEDRRFLFTGDLTESGEKELIRSGQTFFADILKVAHHGSAHSTTVEFLEKADPSFALISAGKDNRYGHPAKETLERLEQKGIPWKNTAESGAIFIKLDDGKITLQTYRDP